MASGWAWAFGSALVLIPAAILIGESRKRRGLGRTTLDEDPTDEDDDEETRKQQYFAKPTRDEGDCLILGKYHPSYKFGEYRVCLSPNQKKVLFKDKKGKKLGCGVFACAYGTSSRTKVVKFTRDSEDVAALLEAQKLDVVPKVYETYKLRDGGHAINTDEETPVYALVVERLKQIPPAERIELDEQLPMIPDVVGGYESIDNYCAFNSKIACETAKAAIKLKEAGIAWEDVHSGNIGLDKNGNVKVLDLGVTGTQLKEQPKILAGLTGARRLQKRALRSV